MSRADDYPPGPNGMVLACQDRIAELEAQKAVCETRAERRPINQQLHETRRMLDWCKTRAGYEPTPQVLGVLDPEEWRGVRRPIATSSKRCAYLSKVSATTRSNSSETVRAARLTAER